MNDPLLHVQIALGLTLLFASTAAHKVRHSARFQAQLAEYRLLPAMLVGPVAWLIVLVELGIAFALPWPALRPAAGAAAAAVLVGYGLAISVNLLRGRSYIDCGCGDTPVLLSSWLLLRNGLLAAAAAALMLPIADRTMGWADLAVALISLPVLILVHRAVEQLLENASVLREWRMSRD